MRFSLPCRRVTGPLLVTAAYVLSSAVALSEPKGAASACGGPGKPPCPLQRWMREQVAAPYASGDLPRLAEVLGELDTFNPAPRKWAHWSSFCAKGSDAASQGNRRAAVIACANCHKIYRRTYNIRYRTRPVPTP